MSLSKLVNNFIEKGIERRGNSSNELISSLLNKFEGSARILQIELVNLPEVFQQRGIYKKNGRNDFMPPRMLKVYPKVAEVLIKIDNFYKGALHYSDIHRTAESSLQAVKANRGAKSPGSSGHNYGFSLDHDLDGNRKRLIDLGYNEFKKKDWKFDYDVMLQDFGFYCHRLDHKLGFEAWHYNHLEPFYTRFFESSRSSSALEQKIMDAYGWHWLMMRPIDIQLGLQRVGLYKGELDGEIGPRSKESIAAFKRTWNLGNNSTMDISFKRTLAYVSSEEVLVENG